MNVLKSILMLARTVQIYSLDLLDKIRQRNSYKVHVEHVYVYNVDHDDKILDHTMDSLSIYFQDQYVKRDILCYDKHLNKL